MHIYELWNDHDPFEFGGRRSKIRTLICVTLISNIASTCIPLLVAADIVVMFWKGLATTSSHATRPKNPFPSGFMKSHEVLPSGKIPWHTLREITRHWVQFKSRGDPGCPRLESCSFYGSAWQNPPPGSPRSQA